MALNTRPVCECVGLTQLLRVLVGVEGRPSRQRSGSAVRGHGAAAAGGGPGSRGWRGAKGRRRGWCPFNVSRDRSPGRAVSRARWRLSCLEPKRGPPFQARTQRKPDAKLCARTWDRTLERSRMVCEPRAADVVRTSNFCQVTLFGALGPRSLRADVTVPKGMVRPLGLVFRVALILIGH